MRSIILFLCFLFLVFLGGLLSVTYYKDSIENDLVKSAQKEIEKSGYPNIDIEANHLQLTVPNVKGSAAMSDLIDEKVKGAYVVASSEPKQPVAPLPDPNLDISIGNNGAVLVSGLVASEALKTQYGEVIGQSLSGAKLDNQLTVDSKVKDVEWASKLPAFLGSYFKVPGVTGFKTDGKEFALSGSVASAELKQKLSADASAALGKYGTIKNQLSITKPVAPIVKTSTPAPKPKKPKPPVVKLNPSLLNIEPNGDGYAVTGKLPNKSGLKDSLLGLISKAHPGKEIKDNIETGSDISAPWWSANAKKLIPEYFTQTSGKGFLRFGPDKIEMGDEFKDKSIFAKLREMASIGKPDSFKIEAVAKVAEKAKPFLTFYRGRDGKFNLEGKVSSDDEKNGILSALSPFGEFNSKLETSDDVANSPWKKTGKLLAAIFKSKERVSARISPDKVVFGGRSTDEKLMNSLNQMAAGITGSESAVESKVRFVTPEVIIAEDKMVDKFRNTAVYFKTASSAIDAKEAPKIKQTAENILKSGTDSPLVVGGYADLRGDAEQNRILSLKRANAVRDELIKLGVSADRMDVRHYGEDTSNVEKSDHWKSRRVELSLNE